MVFGKAGENLRGNARYMETTASMIMIVKAAVVTKKEMESLRGLHPEVRGRVCISSRSYHPQRIQRKVMTLRLSLSNFSFTDWLPAHPTDL